MQKKKGAYMKVFVSSPKEGFENIRKSCKETLEYLGLDFFISEFEGSTPSDSINVCLNEVRNCDIYILLLVNEYGSIIQHKNKSLTEMEFDEARKNNIPIFVYKLEYFDYDKRQREFIKKVEDISTGLFRGEVIYNTNKLKQRLTSDIVNYLAYKKELYPIKYISSIKEDTKHRALASISEQFSPLTSNKIDFNKFYTEIYVQRDIEDWIYRFLSQSEKSTCAVIGGAGSGKSSLISKVSMELINEKNLVLFYNTKYLDFERSLINKICSDLNSPGTEDEESIRRLCRFLNESGEKLIVIFDGINEIDTEQKEKLKIGLANFSSLSEAKNIHTLITCRTIDWKSFIINNPRLQNNLYIEETISDPNLFAFRLSDFNSTEREKSFNVYRDIFKLKGTFTPKISSICSNPWMLRVLAETYENKELPEDIRSVELFRNYYQKKINAIDDSAFSCLIIQALSNYILATGKDNVPISFLIEEPGINLEKAINQIKQLLSLDVLKYGMSTQKNIDFIHNTLRFTYDRFMEFVLADFLLNKWESTSNIYEFDVDRSNEIIISNQKIFIHNFTEWFTGVYEAIKSLRFGVGVIEFILLLLEDNDLRRKGLEILIKSNDILWELTALSVSNKTDNTDISKFITEKILLSRDWEIRSQLAFVIAENFDEISENLAIDTSLKLIQDIDARVITSIIQCFIQKYSIFEEKERKNVLIELAEKPDKRVGNKLCYTIFEEWKKRRLKCENEIFSLLKQTAIPQNRHKMAYLAMSGVKNEKVRQVLENVILTDLIIESNYVYGPWCITIGSLYKDEPDLFDKIISIFVTEEDYRITERIYRFVEPVLHGKKRKVLYPMSRWRSRRILRR